MRGATVAVRLCMRSLGHSKQVIDFIRHEERTRVLAEAEAAPLLTPVEASEAGVKAKQGERPNNVRPSGYGNSQSYIAKRLARDRVDLRE